MTVLYRVAAAAVLGSLLAGCGSAPPPAAVGTTPATSADSTATATALDAKDPATEPTTPPVPEPAESSPPAVELPWPATDAAAVAALQTQVDGGSQPWLLDPAELALSYVATAHSWSGAEATPSASTGDGSGQGTVAVRAADGTELTLTVAQPGRTGSGAIWVVTGETAS